MHRVNCGNFLRPTINSPDRHRNCEWIGVSSLLFAIAVFRRQQPTHLDSHAIVSPLKYTLSFVQGHGFHCRVLPHIAQHVAKPKIARIFLASDSRKYYKPPWCSHALEGVLLAVALLVPHLWGKQETLALKFLDASVSTGRAVVIDNGAGRSRVICTRTHWLRGKQELQW